MIINSDNLRKLEGKKYLELISQLNTNQKLVGRYSYYINFVEDIVEQQTLALIQNEDVFNIFQDQINWGVYHKVEYFALT